MKLYMLIFIAVALFLQALRWILNDMVEEMTKRQYIRALLSLWGGITSLYAIYFLWRIMQ